MQLLVLISSILQMIEAWSDCSNLNASDPSWTKTMVSVPRPFEPSSEFFLSGFDPEHPESFAMCYDVVELAYCDYDSHGTLQIHQSEIDHSMDYTLVIRNNFQSASDTCTCVHFSISWTVIVRSISVAEVISNVTMCLVQDEDGQMVVQTKLEGCEAGYGDRVLSLRALVGAVLPLVVDVPALCRRGWDWNAKNLTDAAACSIDLGPGSIPVCIQRVRDRFKQRQQRSGFQGSSKLHGNRGV